MRSTLLIIGTALLVAIAFGIYLLSQAAPAARSGNVIVAIPATAPKKPTSDEATQLHHGDDVWMKSGDGNMQFRAATYDPHSDGTIDMVKPEVQFMLGGGSMLQIEGETGFVVSPNATNGKVQGQSMEPKRGKMQHVILKQFHAVGDVEPQFTCWLNNVAFDNETFRIATEECDIPDASGQLVHTPADEVPVHVIGQDYDFDGRGLYIKWNERDRKLQRLEIAHGEQLTIKHPSQANEKSPSPGTPGEGRGEGDFETRTALVEPTHPHPAPLPVYRERGPETLALSDNGVAIALVSSDPNAAISVVAAAALPTTTPTTAPKRKLPSTRVIHPPRKRPATRPATKPATFPTSVPSIHRSKEASPYRATFYDNVHVTQVGLTLATADRMNADFFMGSGGSSTKPSTATAPTAAASSESGKRSTSRPTSRPVTRPVTRPSTRSASTRPSSTQPQEQPIVVRWTGKLIVIPPPVDAPVLAANDSAIELIGDTAPAVLDRGGSVIHCALFRYQSLHKIVLLRSSSALPVITVATNDGTHVFCPSLDFDGVDQTADIPGPAHAEFKVATDPSPTTNAAATSPSTRPASIALVDWSDACHLQLIGGEREAMRLKEAVLDGDVHVDHPQIKLISDELDLGFDAVAKTAATTASTTHPTTKPAADSAVLRTMEANGNVDCTMLDTQQKQQHITSSHLTLNTEPNHRGGFDPSLVTADGDVHAFDDSEALSAGHLVAELQPALKSVLAATGPTTSPSHTRNGTDLALRNLTAQEDVHFQSATGDFAVAEQLHVGAFQDIDLLGQPTASVGDRDTTITGPIIRYDPVTKQARVIGPGTMHSLSQGSQRPSSQPAPSSRPVDLAWNGGLFLNGYTNRVNITGGVHTVSVSADGTRNTADGDHIILTLVDAPPATQPTTKSASSTKPSAPGMLGGTAQTNFMKDKIVSVISLLGKGDENVQVISRLVDDHNRIVKSMDLFAPIVNYNKLTDSFVVPTPGKLLVRDFRNQSTTKPAKKEPTTNNAAPGGGGMKGTTAFQWQKDLVFDQHASQATMTGNVVIVHEADTVTNSYRMYADQVVTDLDSSKPATRPATTQPRDNDELKVKRITARGAVRMISTRMQFQASEAVYDPATEIMIARGSPREPAVLIDEQGLSTGTFDELIYNTKTDAISLRNSHTFLRR